MTKQPLNTITAAILIIFYGRERTEQKLISINMYGLIRMFGKSTKVRSAGAKLERKERSLLMQLISQEKSCRGD